nr:MAG TPA: Integrase [Caudoviricetes sp.]
MSNKRMRLPNGFGQISKIKGQNLRNPYRVMVTVGKTDTGRPISRILKPQGYFRTYNDAYGALMRYNKRPYKLDSLTLKNVYEQWAAKYKPTVDPSRYRSICSGWKRCAPIEEMLIRDIRPKHIRELLDSLADTESPNIQLLTKTVLNMTFDFAVEHEYADRNCARECRSTKNINKQLESQTQMHISFSQEELAILWAHKNDSCIRAILIQCYSGWRPAEFLNLRPENINRKNMSFQGGSKTSSGRNRIVPIHPLIRPLVDDAFAEYGYRMFNGEYRHYLTVFHRTITAYGLNELHRPHDARKTFVTLAKNADVDEYAIKRMVGHNIRDITERVYTDRDYIWLKDEIEKIK